MADIDAGIVPFGYDNYMFESDNETYYEECIKLQKAILKRRKVLSESKNSKNPSASVQKVITDDYVLNLFKKLQADEQYLIIELIKKIIQ